MITVALPEHLRSLARVKSDVNLEIKGNATIRSVIDALEEKYPALKGVIREHANGERRAYVRYFACEEDLSHEPQDTLLPEKVVKGEEPFYIIGAISGG